ncbi:MAG: WG repeat-containing protein [Bacteroidales bacterium]|nr:WG repeat-containing protein [Bacteroidales bacterium]
MNKLVFLLILSLTISSSASAQSAYNQLKNMAGSAKVPPASKCVCAYCKSSTPYIHHAGCPYANKTTTLATSSSKSTSPSTSSVVSSLTGSLMTSVLSSYLSGLSDRQARNAQMNAAAEKLFGVPGGEADGFVVAVGTDGYYSIWDDNSKRWAFEEPYASSLTGMILYNSRAVCIQRWMGHKWGVFDMKKGKVGSTNLVKKAVEFYKYDSIKCVAKDAPIAVGLKKGKKYRWGLITKGDNVDTWSHTVEDKWDNFDILPMALTNFAIGHKEGKCALFAQSGKMLTQPLYDAITPAFADDAHTYFFVTLNALWGLINDLGEVLIPCEYENIKYSEEGVSVQKDGKWIAVSSHE